VIPLAPPTPLVPATAYLSGLATIADGVTPRGQHWHLRARADHRDYTAEVALPFPDGDDGGGFQSGALPPATFLSGVSGSGFGRDRDEYEVDGVVGTKVATLRLTTTTGTTILRPRRTPPAALRRYPALKKIKLYVSFPAAEPQRIEALDAAGNVIGTQKL
jgi:hypothetical protein